MDKNCPYQLMTTDVYIIGYDIPIPEAYFVILFLKASTPNEKWKY